MCDMSAPPALLHQQLRKQNRIMRSSQLCSYMACRCWRRLLHFSLFSAATQVAKTCLHAYMHKPMTPHESKNMWVLAVKSQCIA